MESCKECKIEHPIWSLIGHSVPDECMRMSEESIIEKVEITDSKFCTVRHTNYSNFYIAVLWHQSIIEIECMWTFQIWIKVDFETFEDLKKLENYKIYTGKMATEMIWLDKESINYPVRFAYVNTIGQMIVVDVKPGENALYKSFSVGLPYNVVAYLYHRLNQSNVFNGNSNVQNKKFKTR